MATESLNMFQPKTIFIAKNRALGDAIMGLSTVQYFRDLYPESTIIYGVPQWTAKVFAETKTAADFIYPLKINSMSEIIELWSDLLNFQVDFIHEMHQSGRGQKVFSSFSVLKKIPYTAHNHHKKSGTKVIDQGVIKPLIQRDLDGVYSFWGKGQKRPHYLDYPPQMEVANPIVKKRLIFGVVATRETKKWALENFKKLAELIKDFDSQIEIVIPLSLSLPDLKLKKEIEDLHFPKNARVVHWGLDQLANEFSGSQCYIGNDTGIKHLSIAVGVPTITFFGAEPPNEWHPYDEIKHLYFFREGLTCRTRTHHYCGLHTCDLKLDQYNQCLTKILPETVFAEFLKRPICLNLG